MFLFICPCSLITAKCSHAFENIHASFFAFKMFPPPVQPTKLLFSISALSEQRHSSDLRLSLIARPCLRMSQEKGGWKLWSLRRELATLTFAVGWPSRQLRRESSDAGSLSLSSWVVQNFQRCPFKFSV